MHMGAHLRPIDAAVLLDGVDEQCPLGVGPAMSRGAGAPGGGGRHGEQQRLGFKWLGPGQRLGVGGFVG